MPCPGSNFTAIYNENHTQIYVPDGYDTSIPSSVMEIWNSGLKTMNESVSSIFDIQWRTYAIEQEIPLDGGFFNNGSSYLVGDYRQMTSLLLDNTIEPVEGLLVDTVNGGLGFRNHTLPPASTYGSTWTEDILFIQPETACVNTNLTIDFPLPSDPGQRDLIAYDIFLTDRGGFADLDSDYYWGNVNNTQADPDLRRRAYTAAWLNNILSMMYLNITNPSLRKEPLKWRNTTYGKTYPLSAAAGDLNATMSFDRTLGAIDTTSNYGFYLPLAPGVDYLNDSTYSGTPYPNPYGINLDDMTIPGEHKRPWYEEVFVYN
jgi:hypothetical protein